MRIGRALAPAANPLNLMDFLRGLLGLVRGSGELERRREEFSRCFEMRHCYFVSSGKAALTLVLEILKERHPERDQVLIPALTCYSVPAAIISAGLKPILCDIHPKTLDFDFDQLPEKLAQPSLLCVIPTHLFGRPADVQRLKSLLVDDCVTVLEDAAQALGGFRDGQRLGTLADVGIFSLGRGKALSTIEGGMIMTREDNLGALIADRVASLPGCRALDLLRLIGYALALMILIRPACYWFPASLPLLQLGSTQYNPVFKVGRFSAFQAGLLSGWEKKLAKLQRVRRTHTAFWSRTVKAELQFYSVSGDRVSDLIRFPLLMADKNQSQSLTTEGKRHGLGLASSYPDAISGISSLREHFAGTEYPIASQTAAKLLTLPVHPFVRRSDRVKILALLAKSCARQSSREASFSGFDPGSDKRKRDISVAV